MSRVSIVMVVCASIAVTGGCGTTPPSHFYTLSANAKPAPASSSLAVSVGPVSVPAVVDRPEIVVRVNPNEVRPDEFNRWASPLQDNLGRAVAENLVAMLGTPYVTVFPQSEAVGADYRVAIQVQAFESAPGESATLDAVWTVRQAKDGKFQTGRTTVRETTQRKGYDALAAAHSRAVAALSQNIAAAVRALESDSGK
jgi:uncharacterized lipoprotein YmbA